MKRGNQFFLVEQPYTTRLRNPIFMSICTARHGELIVIYEYRSESEEHCALQRYLLLIGKK